VEEIRALGRFFERKVVHRHYGNWEIGNPVDKKSLQLGIAKSETPTRGRKAPSWGPAESHREIAHQDIGNPVGTSFMPFGIVMSETQTRGKTAVTGDSGQIGQELSQEG
jgi:hypothetical protein